MAFMIVSRSASFMHHIIYAARIRSSIVDPMSISKILKINSSAREPEVLHFSRPYSTVQPGCPFHSAPAYSTTHKQDMTGTSPLPRMHFDHILHTFCIRLHHRSDENIFCTDSPAIFRIDHAFYRFSSASSLLSLIPASALSRLIIRNRPWRCYAMIASYCHKRLRAWRFRLLLSR